MNDRKQIGILGVNGIYLLTAILLLTVGSYYQQRDVKSGLLITEYIVVLLPPIIYTKIKGDSLRRVLRLNSLSLKDGILVVAITILSYPGALFFNLVVMAVLSTFGKLDIPPIPTAGNLVEYGILFGIFAVSAGICEEVFFRGLVMAGYERIGRIRAVIISALLFGLFHFNIENLAGPVVLGLVFGLLVQRTQSLFAGIIGHITNNGIAVTLGFMSNLASAKLNGENRAKAHVVPSTQELVQSAWTIGVIAIFTGFLALFLFRMIKNTKVDQMDNGMEMKKPSWVMGLPVFLTMILYVYVIYRQIVQITN